MRISPKLWLVPVAIFFMTALPQCNEADSDDASHVQDIFREDENGIRRKQASAEERLWTISMNGCTGHLLSPEHMMTAAHCSPRAGARYTSGAAMNAGQSGDITVEQVLEQSSQLDYSILKIRWAGPPNPKQKFPPRVATSAADVKSSRTGGQGDEIFTVGFPGDKVRSWGATYSEGRAKEVRGSLLRYNIGIINGNSGGGVWRKSDGMLVSLTNGGPSILGQRGWNNRNLEDSTAWNHGAAMWNVYASSRVLKDIFPNGRNRFVQADSNVIHLAFGAPDNRGAETHFVFIATPSTVQELWYCVDQANCDADVGSKAIQVKVTSDGIRTFRTTTPVSLRNGMKFGVAAPSPGLNFAAEFRQR